MSEKCALYIRVSSDKQRDNYSPPSQLRACLEYASRMNYEVVGDRFVDLATARDSADGVRAYVDDYTALELNRPALDAAFRFADTDGFDVLVVHAIDRLARDPYIRQTIENELSVCGIRVDYVLGNYDDSAEGEVKKDLDSTFSRWENAKRVERSTRGKIQKAMQGNFCSGRLPFGYEYDGGQTNGLRIVEEQAEVINVIFSWYVQDGYSLRQISETLTAQKIISPTGKERWGRTTVANILSNSIYCGKGIYNVRKTVKRGLKKIRIYREESELIRFATPPIIEESTFREAAIKLAENKIIRRRPAIRKYLLSGKIFCENCGRVYLATATGNPASRIYRHRVREGHCHNKSISAEKLESFTWQLVRQKLLDPEELRRGYLDCLANEEETRSFERTHLETLKRKVLSLEEKRRNLNMAFLDPDLQFSKKEFIEMKSLIDGEIQALSHEIEGAERSLDNLPTLAGLQTLETFIEKVQFVFDNEAALIFDDIKQIYDLLHLKVYLTLEGEVGISGYFSDGLLSNPSARSDRLVCHASRRLMRLVDRWHPLAAMPGRSPVPCR
jgi:site-specific DNA recombinase